MEEKTPEKSKKSLLRRWRIFRHARPLASWGVILAVVVVLIVVVGGVGSMTYDYTQNNPKFCLTCHDIMIESYETWENSEHAEVNCHSCHYLTPEYVKSFSLSVLKGMPEKIPPRPLDKIIVPDKYCMKCHWDAQDQHGDAGEWSEFLFPKTHVPEDSNKVTDSRFHALHYFMGPTACTVCHGKKRLHTFTSEPEDCLDCHQDQHEQFHAAQEIELACFNCHTDRTADLNPDREKCLFCHGEDDTLRQDLLAAGTIDVKYAQPPEDLIAQATKMAVHEDAPMQDLSCNTCHQSHQGPDAQKTSSEACISCHPSIENVGQHPLHLRFVQSDCMKCHLPHSWEFTEEQAQQECAKCHEYQPPISFIQAQK
ncbi:hypothetical protein GF339_22910 [candidate division KSB3 bacterium]|uniref:NapC/NirT cytochrome c N-terminal domain-containing protein n=1 Tax=candidate division KSB3 bacterium TaxID=2044937 RepID=A0A9D5K0L9_9BACT|nr:hypothetical protein [candidate division KSB3 bacterium]MBD3327455.1 hypothetical protein [candidate division KSB3 bacterium]